jgi:hypothetical protein
MRGGSATAMVMWIETSFQRSPGGFCDVDRRGLPCIVPITYAYDGRTLYGYSLLGAKLENMGARTGCVRRSQSIAFVSLRTAVPSSFVDIPTTPERRRRPRCGAHADPHERCRCRRGRAGASCEDVRGPKRRRRHRVSHSYHGAPRSLFSSR